MITLILSILRNCEITVWCEILISLNYDVWCSYQIIDLKFYEVEVGTKSNLGLLDNLL